MLVLLLLTAFGHVVQTGASNFTDADTRQAAAQLSSHIQNLSISKQKIPPKKTSPLSPLAMVKVDLEVYVTMVLSVDDTEQTLSTLTKIYVWWMDEALAWNASDHANVQSVEIAASSVWTPDIKVVTSLFLSGVQDEVRNVLVYSNGSMYTAIAYKLDTTCKMDHALFPYDTQSCNIRFQPLSNIILMNVSKSGIFEEAIATGSFANQWDLTGVRTTDQLTITVDIKRKSLFYTVCLVLPLVLTCFMNTLVFLVPLQSGEKISFLVSIFVFNSVFISFFNDVMPRGLEAMPVTMTLAAFVIVESFVVLVVTLLIMTRHHSLVNKDGDVSSDVRIQETGPSDLDEISDGIMEAKHPSGSESIDVNEKKKKTDTLRTIFRSCLSRVSPFQANGACDDGDAADNAFQASGKAKKRRFDLTPAVIDRVCFFVFFCINCLILTVTCAKLIKNPK